MRTIAKEHVNNRQFYVSLIRGFLEPVCLPPCHDEHDGVGGDEGYSRNENHWRCITDRLDRPMYATDARIQTKSARTSRIQVSRENVLEVEADSHTVHLKS